MLKTEKVVIKHKFVNENKLILLLPLAEHTCGGCVDGGGGGGEGGPSSFNFISFFVFILYPITQ